MRYLLTTKKQMLFVIVIFTIIFGSFIYEFVSNPDDFVKAGLRRYGGQATHTLDIMQGQLILPFITIYFLILGLSIYFYLTKMK